MCLFLHRHKHSTRRKVLKRVVEVQRRKIRPLPSVLQCRVFKRDQPACICGSRQGERPPAKTCSQAWSVLVSLWPCARSKMAQLPDRFWTLTQHHFRSVLHVASWISQVLRSEVPLYNKLWILRRVDPVGRAIVPPLKPTKVTLFAISWCNSENNISKPIPNTSLVKFEFPHCSRYKTILSTIVLSQQCCEVYFISLNSSGADTRLDYQILLKSPPPPNVTRWIHPWFCARPTNMVTGAERCGASSKWKAPEQEAQRTAAGLKANTRSRRGWESRGFRSGF